MDADKVQAILDFKELIKNLPETNFSSIDIKKFSSKFIKLYRSLVGKSFPISFSMTHNDPKDLVDPWKWEVVLKDRYHSYLMTDEYKKIYGDNANGASRDDGDYKMFFRYLLYLTDRDYMTNERWYLPLEEAHDTPLMKILRELHLAR